VAVFGRKGAIFTMLCLPIGNMERVVGGLD